MDISMHNTETHPPCLTSYANIISKSIICQNVKCEIIKLLEENIGENVHGFKWSKDFLNIVSKFHNP